MAVRTRVDILQTTVGTVLDFRKIIIERCAHCLTEIPIEERRREVFVWGERIDKDNMKAHVCCSKRCVELHVAEHVVNPDIYRRQRP